VFLHALEQGIHLARGVPPYPGIIVGLVDHQLRQDHDLPAPQEELQDGHRVHAQIAVRYGHDIPDAFLRLSEHFFVLLAFLGVHVQVHVLKNAIG
jgi:hypothetical protein